MSESQIIEDGVPQRGDTVTYATPWNPSVTALTVRWDSEPSTVAMGGTSLKIISIERPVPSLPSIPGTRFSAEVTRSANHGKVTERVWLMVYGGSGGLVTYTSHKLVCGNTHHADGHINASTVTHVTLPEED